MVRWSSSSKKRENNPMHSSQVLGRTNEKKWRSPERSRPDHRQFERSAVGCGMVHGLVGMVEIEGGGLVFLQPEQSRAHQRDQAACRIRRIHPDAVDADAVAH